GVRPLATTFVFELQGGGEGSDPRPSSHSVLIRSPMTRSCTQRKKMTSSIIMRPMTLTCSASPFIHILSITTESTSDPAENRRIEALSSRMMPKKVRIHPTANEGQASATMMRHKVCHQLAPCTREHSSRS